MKKESLQEKNNLFVYIMLFFALAFIGWCFEVLNEIRKGHGFINRGVLHGPWLPIYGFGGLIIYILLKKYYKKPIIVFSLSFIISAIIEYFTSFYRQSVKYILKPSKCLAISKLLCTFAADLKTKTL